MINKYIENESDYLKKYGFVFSNSKSCKLIGFCNNFRYQTLNKHWQYGGLAFENANNEDCDLNISSTNQIEDIVYTD